MPARPITYNAPPSTTTTTGLRTTDAAVNPESLIGASCGEVRDTVTELVSLVGNLLGDHNQFLRDLTAKEEEYDLAKEVKSQVSKRGSAFWGKNQWPKHVQNHAQSAADSAFEDAKARRKKARSDAKSHYGRSAHKAAKELAGTEKWSMGPYFRPDLPSVQNVVDSYYKETAAGASIPAMSAADSSKQGTQSIGQ